MGIPDYQTLMLPVLRLAASGEQRVGTAAERIADELGLSEEERATMLPSGRQRLLNNRIHWAKFYMSKAELISSPGRGRFVATEQGRQLLTTNPSQVNVALLMKYPTFGSSTKVRSKRPTGRMPYLTTRQRKRTR